MDYFLSDKFKERAEALLAKYKVPGVAVAITHNERIESLAFGLATLEPPVPCTTDTLFDIASASKSMTAASVALLVEDKRYPELRYDAIMSELLPGDFVMPTEELTKQVNVDDILSHRTGMPTHDWSYLGTLSQTPDTSQSVVRNLRNLPVCAPLRTRYMYNNMMYTTAAYLVEKKSGLTFSDFLETNFFRPLGMTSTSLQPSRARAKGFSSRMAQGYTWVAKEERQAPVPMVECPEADGAGSVITSVDDYVKWVHAMLLQQAPVTEAVYSGLLRARTITEPDPAKELATQTTPNMYCAGLQTNYYRGQLRVEHGGGVTGWATKQFFLPGHKFGGIVTANSGDGGHSVGYIMVRELIDELLQVPDAERPNWQVYVDKLDEKDDQSADGVEAEIRRDILSELGDGKEGDAELEPEPLTTPLAVYTGAYEHPGYHEFVLGVKDGKLFVNAEDRSFGFTGVFTHVASQTMFTVRITESEQIWGGQDMTAIKAKFKLVDGRVSMLGLALEPDMEDTDEEMIWFKPKN